MIAWALSNPTIVALIAAVIGGLGWGYQQRRAGAKANEAKHAAEELRARDIHDDVQDDIGTLTPAQKRERLKTW